MLPNTLGKVNKLIFQGVLECILQLCFPTGQSSIAPCGLKTTYSFSFSFGVLTLCQEVGDTGKQAQSQPQELTPA